MVPIQGLWGLHPLCLLGGASSGQTPLSPGRCLSAGLIFEAAWEIEVQPDAGAVGQGPGAVWYPVQFAALLWSPGTRGTRHA